MRTTTEKIVLLKRIIKEVDEVFKDDSVPKYACDDTDELETFGQAFCRIADAEIITLQNSLADKE